MPAQPSPTFLRVEIGVVLIVQAEHVVMPLLVRLVVLVLCTPAMGVDVC